MEKWECLSWEVPPAETTQPHLNILTQGRSALIPWHATRSFSKQARVNKKKHDHKIVQELRELVASEAQPMLTLTNLLKQWVLLSVFKAPHVFRDMWHMSLCQEDTFNRRQLLANGVFNKQTLC